MSYLCSVKAFDSLSPRPWQSRLWECWNDCGIRLDKERIFIVKEEERLDYSCIGDAVSIADVPLSQNKTDSACLYPEIERHQA